MKYGRMAAMLSIRRERSGKNAHSLSIRFSYDPSGNVQLPAQLPWEPRRLWRGRLKRFLQHWADESHSLQQVYFSVTPVCGGARDWTKRNEETAWIYAEIKRLLQF